MSFKQLTDMLRPPLADIAEHIQTTQGTLLTYRARGDKPSPVVRERLASYMRERAKLLQAAADELEAGE